MSSARGLRLLKSLENFAKSNKVHFDHTNVISKLKFIESKDGCLRGIVTVEPSMCNMYNVLHGGYIATIFDTITNISLLEFPDGSLSLSSNFNINFMRPVLVGERLLFETTPLKYGKFSIVEATLLKEKTRKLVAKGTVSLVARPEGEQRFLKETTGFDVYEK